MLQTPHLILVPPNSSVKYSNLLPGKEQLTP